MLILYVGFWIGHAIIAAILFIIEMVFISRVDWKKKAAEAHNRVISALPKTENSHDAETTSENNNDSNPENIAKLSNLDKKFPLKHVLIKCIVMVLFIAVFIVCILTRNLYHPVFH